MILTTNQKIALDELKNVTANKDTLTSQGASIIISILCDLNADNKELQDKLSRRNMQIKELRKQLQEKRVAIMEDNAYYQNRIKKGRTFCPKCFSEFTVQL